MFTRRYVAALGAGVALTAGVIAAQGSASATVPPPASNTTVGVMVDSIDGLTRTNINCYRDGQFQTVNGDATLIMTNRTPHTMICVITIRPKAV